ncbi:unnamed protein product [Durusdinium trenchii]|uniref:Uncharacterized protein n=1 Tax=Durusdinium trenchii TaxID=1381693 RepID=A0ABP0M4D7_9DINO
MFEPGPGPTAKIFAKNLGEGASSSSQIRTAKAVAEELGEAAASESGVFAWAKVRTKDSERGTQRIVRKQQTTMQVPITDLDVLGQRVAWIDPQAWLQYILDHGLLYMLSGLIRGTTSNR